MTDDQRATEEPAIRVGNEALVDETPSTRAIPWVSYLVIVLCLVIFLMYSQEDPEDWQALARFGVLTPGAIWDGGYWSLVASAFVHHEIWHFGLNAYWLWRLGSRLEVAIGSWTYLTFLLISAFVSSSFQMAVSDTTGIGASGMAYAIFGWMWITCTQHPRFQEVLDRSTVQIFFLWLIACTVLTALNVWVVGNAAHLSGIVFGITAGVAWTAQPRSPRTVARPIGILVLSFIPLFWCPWSTG